MNMPIVAVRKGDVVMLGRRDRMTVLEADIRNSGVTLKGLTPKGNEMTYVGSPGEVVWWVAYKEVK